MGLSLNQILVLLAQAIMGVQARPGRTTLHRWIKSAGIAAGRVLKHLDVRCQALVLVGCLDEIFFHRRPVLVGVEPTSMVWFLGEKANDRTGSTWSRALQDFPVLVRPGGCGNGPASRDRCGATATATGRETAVGERPRCVPHHPGVRRLRQIWSRVERLWSRPKRPIAGSLSAYRLRRVPFLGCPRRPETTSCE